MTGFFSSRRSSAKGNASVAESDAPIDSPLAKLPSTGSGSAEGNQGPVSSHGEGAAPTDALDTKDPPPQREIQPSPTATLDLAGAADGASSGGGAVAPEGGGPASPTAAAAAPCIGTSNDAMRARLEQLRDLAQFAQRALDELLADAPAYRAALASAQASAAVACRTALGTATSAALDAAGRCMDAAQRCLPTDDSELDGSRSGLRELFLLLASSLPTRTLRAGEILISEGEVFEAMHLLVSGHLVLTIPDQNSGMLQRVRGRGVGGGKVEWDGNGWGGGRRASAHSLLSAPHPIHTLPHPHPPHAHARACPPGCSCERCGTHRSSAAPSVNAR